MKWYDKIPLYGSFVILLTIALVMVYAFFMNILSPESTAGSIELIREHDRKIVFEDVMQTESGEFIVTKYTGPNIQAAANDIQRAYLTRLLRQPVDYLNHEKHQRSHEWKIYESEGYAIVLRVAEGIIVDLLVLEDASVAGP